MAPDVRTDVRSGSRRTEIDHLAPPASSHHRTHILSLPAAAATRNTVGMASLLVAALLATHIGAALGEQPIPHSAEPIIPAQHLSCKGWAALRLENVRLRRRLAKTQRALGTVSRQAEACAVEAKQCGELRRVFVILEHENQKLRWANARLAEKPAGPRPGGQALKADGGKPHARRTCLRSPQWSLQWFHWYAGHADVGPQKMSFGVPRASSAESAPGRQLLQSTAGACLASAS
jgi:hypothetical protein